MIALSLSVTERRLWRPPYQTGKTVHVPANALQTRRGRTNGAGCARPWFRIAESFGERRCENWITHTKLDGRAAPRTAVMDTFRLGAGNAVMRIGTQQQRFI